VELRQYRYVLALADYASFRKASEAIGISQPTPTKSLFQIEREVGQRALRQSWPDDLAHRVRRDRDPHSP
jgi:LysR family cyn operon transcriptional activator